MGTRGVTNDIKKLDWLLKDEDARRAPWVYDAGSYYFLRFEASDHAWSCKIVK